MLGKTNVKVKPNKKVQYVEYIESTGTQYIDTGFVPTENSKFELDIQYTSVPTGNLSDNSYRNGIGGATTYSRFICGYNNTGFYYGVGGKNIDKTYGDINRHVFTVDLKNMQYGYDGTLETVSTTYSNPNSLPYTIFARYSLIDGTIDSYSKQKLYGCKIYDNDMLVRDFKPCKDGAGVYCLYDEVEKRYYYNQGTGQFIGDGLEPTQLEYIESTGTQYIDTGVVPQSNNLKVELEIYVTSISTTEKDFFGNVIETDTNSGRIIAGFYQGNVFLYSRTSKTGSNDGNVNNTNLQVNSKNMVVIEFDGTNKKRTLTINGVSVSSNTFNTNIVNTNNLALFSGGINAFTEKTSMRLYSSKIYDNGILIRDYIPALDHNNVVCLYDKVSKTCFYNAGTGEFLGGVVV